MACAISARAVAARGAHRGYRCGMGPVSFSSLVEELQRAHDVHTVIVYGSHARGDATDESDIDVAGYADACVEPLRDARLWRGVYLDGFVYPTAHLTAAPDPEMLKLCGGRVVLDARGLAGPLLERLAAFDRAGPPVLAEPEQRMRRVWAHKMLGRIRRDDLEARYRRHWLVYALLEDYYALRARWYRGPKLALIDLAQRDPATLAAFERALAPGAPLDALDALVARVTA